MKKNLTPNQAFYEMEAKSILESYQKLCQLLESSDPALTPLVQKAFDLSYEVYIERQKELFESAMPGLNVAMIITKEIGLRDPVAVAAAFLYDVAAHKGLTQEQLAPVCGNEVAKIVWTLLQLKTMLKETGALKRNRFEVLFSYLTEDKRVIVLQLAQGLNSMRFLNAVPEHERPQFATQIRDFYMAVANRLALNDIKAELGDLYLKWSDPSAYFTIARQLKKRRGERLEFILTINQKLKKLLEKQGFKFRIETRIKSIYSIYHKIQRRNIPLDQIYDLIALRVVLSCSRAEEAKQCWRVYNSIVAAYQPNNLRTRNWISTPRPSNYQSLHVTILTDEGIWIELQIRSKRMHEVASYGQAAHWYYKEDNEILNIPAFNKWLKEVRKFIQTTAARTRPLFEEVQHSIALEEVTVFDEAGLPFVLPRGASVLDFAIAKMGKQGLFCTHAVIQAEACPLHHTLKSHDQIELRLDIRQLPNDSWFHFIITQKAQKILTDFLRHRRLKHIGKGKKIMSAALSHEQLPCDDEVIEQFQEFFHEPVVDQLYEKIGIGLIQEEAVQAFVRQVKERKSTSRLPELLSTTFIISYRPGHGNQETYQIKECCKPIAGEEVLGLISPCENVHIHSTRCPNAQALLAKAPAKVVAAQWKYPTEPVEVTLSFSATNDAEVRERVVTALGGYDIRLLVFSYDYLTQAAQGCVAAVLPGLVSFTEFANRLGAVPGVSEVQRVMG